MFFSEVSQESGVGSVPSNTFAYDLEENKRNAMKDPSQGGSKPKLVRQAPISKVSWKEQSEKQLPLECNSELPLLKS